MGQHAGCWFDWFGSVLGMQVAVDLHWGVAYLSCLPKLLTHQSSMRTTYAGRAEIGYGAFWMHLRWISVDIRRYTQYKFAGSRSLPFRVRFLSRRPRMRRKPWRPSSPSSIEETWWTWTHALWFIKMPWGNPSKMPSRCARCNCSLRTWGKGWDWWDTEFM